MKKLKYCLALSILLGVCGGLWSTTLQKAKAVKAEVISGYHVPKIVDFVCGEYHNLAIDSNGNLWQWGCKNGSQTTPRRIMAGTRFVQIAADLDHSVALDDAGNAYEWTDYNSPVLIGTGKNGVGVVGQGSNFLSVNGDVSISYCPRAFGNFIGSAKVSMFLDSDGNLKCEQQTSSKSNLTCASGAQASGYKYQFWNTNGDHYCYRFTLLRSVPNENGFRINQVACDRYYGYVPRLDSSTTDLKRVGAGNLLDVNSLSEGTFVDFGMTKTSTNSADSLDSAVGFAVRNDGVVFSFGKNKTETNLLGSEETLTIGGQVNDPKQIKLDQKALKVDAGANHAIVLCEDGNLYAWGSNVYGQLGMGDNTVRTLPTLVPFFTNNTQYSFTVAKGESYEGTFALDGMNSYVVNSAPTQGNLVLDSGTGEFTYTPDNSAGKTDYFTIDVSDGVANMTYIVNVTIDCKPVWQSFETAFNVRRGESLNGNASANDDDGDTLKFSILQHPLKGTATINQSSGSFAYTPNGDAAGNDSFKIAVSDGYFTIEKTINVHVETYIEVSDVYERTFDVLTSPAHFDSQLVAVDEDGDELTWSVVKQPTLGSLTLNAATGAYSYDADQGKTGDDTFIIQVTDGVTPIEKEYTVHLFSIKDAGTSLAHVTTTGVPFSSQILTEAKNTTIHYSVKTQGTLGEVTLDSATGEYTYTPNDGTRGQDSFVVTVSHTYGSYDVEVFVYQNSVPDGSLVQTNIVVGEGGTYDGSVACSDLDLGDTLSYAVLSSPLKGNVVLNASTGVYSYQAVAGQAGDDSFSIRVSDGLNEITISVSVHIETIIETDANLYHSVSENTSVSGVISATDRDGDAISYSMKTGASNGVASVTDQGAYSYIPITDFHGDDLFVVTLTDGVTPVDVTIHVHVNRKPIVATDPVIITAHGSPIAGAASATDPDGDVLTYSIYTQGTKGVASVDSLSGNFSYAPNQDAAGDDAFVIKASDGIDFVLINVHVHNETELVIDTANTNLVANQGKTLNGQVIATDPDGDALSYSTSIDPQKGTLTLNVHTGAWSYQCNADATGEDEFEIAVTDGVLEKKVTYHLTINIPPVVSETTELSFVTNQGTPFIGTIEGLDHDGDALVYSVVSQGEKGAVTIDSVTGQYRYTPNDGAAGNDSFVLGISDGTFLTQVVISAHIESDIVVEGDAQNVNVAKGQIANGSIQVSDADGDTLTFAIFQQGTKGTAAITAAGAWSYNANGEGAGADTFIVSVTDGTHTKYVTVFVHVDSLPTFGVDSITLEASPNKMASATVTAQDADGDELTYSIHADPQHGTASINQSTGSFDYTNTEKAVSDSFVIAVRDAHGNEATVIVNVIINNPPTPAQTNPQYQVNQGGACSGKIVVTDLDGDALTYRIAEKPRYGSVQLDSTTGEFNYKANPFAAGDSDSFVVEVSDGFNTSQVLVQMKINSTAMNAVFISAGAVAYTAVVVAAVLLIGKLRKKGR